MATTAWKHHSFAADANDGSVLSVIQADLSTSSVVDVDRVVGNTILRSFSLGKKLLARDVADAKIEIDAFVDFSNISGKPTTVAGYGITDAVSAGLIGAPDGLATLDSSGKLTAGQLPPISITDTFVVASQAAMLALAAQTGDVAVRTDLNKSYILKGTDPSVLADWQELLSPTDAVTSVNGQTGVVDITFALLSAKPTTIVGFGITDAYTKTELQTSGQSSVHFDNVSNKPTTIVGFGITDAYTKTELQTSGQSSVHFGNVSSKPTTLAGYGITDTVITDAFVHVANSVGTSQFSAVGLDTVRFAAGADLGVTFDPATKTITFAFTGSTSGITQAAADARYLQLTGGTLSGGLTSVSLTVTGGVGGANQIFKGSTTALSIYGGTGTSYDFGIFTAAGTPVLRVPTGTADVVVNNVSSGGGNFTGNVTVGAHLSVTGLVNMNGGATVRGLVVPGAGAGGEFLWNGSYFTINSFSRTSGLYMPMRIEATTITLNGAPTTGNVLVGTYTDSVYKLDVNGTGRFSNTLTLTGAVTNPLYISVNYAGLLRPLIQNLNATGRTELWIRNDAGHSFSSGMNGSAVTGDFVPGLTAANLSFVFTNNGTNGLAVGATSAQPLYFFTNNAVRAQFDALGRFLVGTSSEAPAAFTVARFAGTTPEVRITDEASYYATLGFYAKGGGATPTFVGNIGTYWGHGMIYTAAAGHGHTWRVNGTSDYAMRLFSSGRLVLSDVASPVDAGYKLDVLGTMRVTETLSIGTLAANADTYFRGRVFLRGGTGANVADWVLSSGGSSKEFTLVNNVDSTNAIFVPGTGANSSNVGIRTTTPGYALTVNGSAQVDNFGANKATPVGKQTVPAAASDLTSVITLANAMRAAGVAFGLYS